MCNRQQQKNTVLKCLYPPTSTSTSVAFFNVRVLCFRYYYEYIIHSILLLANSAIRLALLLLEMLHGHVLINGSK